MLDEIEELDLVLQHYAMTWGIKLPREVTILKAQWWEWGMGPIGNTVGKQREVQ